MLKQHNDVVYSQLIAGSTQKLKRQFAPTQTVHGRNMSLGSWKRRKTKGNCKKEHRLKAQQHATSRQQWSSNQKRHHRRKAEMAGDDQRKSPSVGRGGLENFTKSGNINHFNWTCHTNMEHTIDRPSYVDDRLMIKFAIYTVFK